MRPILYLFLSLGMASPGQPSQDFQAMAAELRSAQGKGRTVAMDTIASHGAQAFPILTELVRDKDSQIAWMARQELVRIKDPRVLPVLLRGIETEKDEGMIGNHLLAIGNHGNPTAMKEVIRYVRHKLPLVRWGAVYALGALGHPAAIPTLQSLQKDPGASVRWQARESIKHIRAMTAKYPDRLRSRGWWAGG